jgi:hypothetical protein
MNWWLLGGAIAIAVLLFVAHRLGWIDMSNKNRSSGTHGGVMGIGDEVFHPTRHEAQIELERQTVLPAPAPLAGDGDKGIFNGKVVIDLSKDRRS